MTKYRFTVFTATYNRSQTLHRVYDSLLKQTYKEFEWLIIDDGSTDETKELVNKFILDNKLNIRYFYKNNGGKHTAWRMAMEYVDSKYMICLDSDDEIVPDCLRVFNSHWKALEKLPNYDDFWEVKALCVDQNDNLVGNKFPSEVYDSCYADVVFKKNYWGEQFGCRKVTVLAKEAKVPDSFTFDERANNFPEGIRWARAGAKYKTRYINDVLRCYYTDSSDSLCYAPKSRSSIYNSLVASLYYLDENCVQLIKNCPVKFFKSILSTVVNLILVNEPLLCFLNKFDSKLIKLVILGFYPLSFIVIKVFRNGKKR